MIAQFMVPGQPQGKGRARSFVRNGKVGHHTPAKTRSYEGVITTLAMEAMQGRAPQGCPMMIELVIGMQIPSSWPEWKKTAALCNDVAPTTKPDADNVLKAIKDACNGVVWRDDCQVVQVSLTKIYVFSPGVMVTVYGVDKKPAQDKKRG